MRPARRIDSSKNTFVLITFGVSLARHLKLCSCKITSDNKTSPLRFTVAIGLPISIIACIAPLGMERKSISDNQISASSQLNGNHSAIQARLHSKAGAWSPLTNDDSQWLQVDLGSDTRVTRVATQGSNAYNESVTKYNLQYSDDGVTFQFYKDVGDSSAKVFARFLTKYTLIH